MSSKLPFSLMLYAVDASLIGRFLRRREPSSKPSYFIGASRPAEDATGYCEMSLRKCSTPLRGKASDAPAGDEYSAILLLLEQGRPGPLMAKGAHGLDEHHISVED